jgi:hypothetical protein
VAASLRTDEQMREMFRERLVWDKPEDITLLRAKGLVMRIYAPQVRRPASRPAQPAPMPATHACVRACRDGAHRRPAQPWAAPAVYACACSSGSVRARSPAPRKRRRV